MSNFSKRIKEVRESLGMNKTQFAEFIKTSLSNITRYEKDSMGVSLESVKAIGEKLNINPGWLLGWDSEKYLNEKQVVYKKIPLVGTIAAGEPIFAHEYIEGYEHVEECERVDFCLKVKGDSMINARILDGDIVFIRQQPDVENGDIAAVIIDNENATLKRVYQINGTVVLRAENPNYPDRIFSKKDVREVKILGKAISFKSSIK